MRHCLSVTTGHTSHNQLGLTVERLLQLSGVTMLDAHAHQEADEGGRVAVHQKVLSHQLHCRRDARFVERLDVFFTERWNLARLQTRQVRYKQEAGRSDRESESCILKKAAQRPCGLHARHARGSNTHRTHLKRRGVQCVDEEHMPDLRAATLLIYKRNLLRGWTRAGDGCGTLNASISSAAVIFFARALLGRCGYAPAPRLM